MPPAKALVWRVATGSLPKSGGQIFQTRVLSLIHNKIHTHRTDRHTTTNTYMISSKMTTTTTGIQSRRAGTRSSFVSNASLATHLLLLLLLAFFSLVSSTPSDSLNRYVENYMSRRHIPSIAALRITDRGTSTRSC